MKKTLIPALIAFVAFTGTAMGKDRRGDVQREAARIATFQARYNPDIVVWKVDPCFRNPGKPWRCVIRSFYADGTYCDAVATIAREARVDHEGRVLSYGRRMVTRRLHVLPPCVTA